MSWLGSALSFIICAGLLPLEPLTSHAALIRSVKDLEEISMTALSGLLQAVSFI